MGTVACTGSERGLVEYRSATWWDGQAESSGSLFVKDGVFIDANGAVPERTVDLAGTLVTAPFAEGHNHNLVEAIFERSNAEYLRSGVFYVKVPTTYPPAIADIRDELDRSDTVDATFSMGGLTKPGGHPVSLFVDVLSQSIYGGASYDDFKGQAFHEVSSETEIAEAIGILDEQGADFVKALIMFSEDYEGTAFESNRGLHPELLPTIVEEAHSRDLPVTLHVNSAADFRAGVAAGVDEIAHLPGIAWPDSRSPEAHRLTIEDAEDARDAGVAVVTSTYVIKVRYKDQPEKIAAFEAMQKYNLALLKDAGVEIRIGSDMYDRDGTGVGADPTRGEVENLVSMGAFDAESALALWIDTGRKIFPDRRIACFEPGCEASFLVFDADPRVDIANLASLEAGIKEGILVTGELD